MGKLEEPPLLTVTARVACRFSHQHMQWLLFVFQGLLLLQLLISSATTMTGIGTNHARNGRKHDHNYFHTLFATPIVN